MGVVLKDLSNDPLRILFLSDNFPPESNAPASRLWEHAIRWVKGGAEVTVITTAPNFPEGKVFPGYRNAWRNVEYVDGIRVVRVKTYITANEGFLRRSLDYISFMVIGTLMSFLERRPHVVVATSPQFFCAIAGWLVGIIKWRPFALELRDIWPASIVAVGAMRRNYVIRLLEVVELFLYRRASAIIPVTGSIRDELIERGVDERKLHVVLNGVDLSRFHPVPKDPTLSSRYGLQGKFVIGYIGTHGMAHALDKVLEAIEILLPREDIAFFFVGSGAERASVERTVTERTLTNVRLISRQPKEEMPAFWGLCDFSLVPLKNTPLFSGAIPSKIFESVGMGVPVLLSVPEGEATRIVRDAQVGRCVPPEDPRLLAAAISELAERPELVATLRSNALAVAPQFSRDDLATKMLSILRDIGRR